MLNDNRTAIITEPPGGIPRIVRAMRPHSMDGKENGVWFAFSPMKKSGRKLIVCSGTYGDAWYKFDEINK